MNSRQQEHKVPSGDWFIDSQGYFGVGPTLCLVPRGDFVLLLPRIHSTVLFRLL